MIGILCEKPSAARNFAKALGGNSGTYNGETYKIVPSHGHLYEFVEPDKQVSKDLSARYKSWRPEYLPWNEKEFAWKKELKDKKDDTPDKIKSVLSTCDEICIATDDDPTGEGELLAWEIIYGLGIKAKKYTRMYFVDESEAEIRKAFVGRKTLGTSLSCMYDDPDYKQADFRSRWDFLSIQWTRVATHYAGGEIVPRQGRLKSAMVKIVGDQIKAVEDYVKKPFYQNRFKDENGIDYVSKSEPQYEKKEDVPNIYKASDVVLDTKGMKHTAPPKFLDLASLSAILASEGIKAEDVLTTYQAMYQDQIVSYPRTEDHEISKEQFNELLPLVDRIAKVVGVNPSILTHRSARATHVKNGGSHGANRPGSVVPKDLSSLAKYGSCAPRIYELLARNYLATLAEDYEYEQQKGHVKDFPKFEGTANVPMKPGWKAVYSEGDEEEKSSGKGLGRIANPYVYEGANPKPKMPTMKWLMKQLEKRNVGTGATRTSIYADVTNAKSKNPLLIEKKGKLTMAEAGTVSYKLLPNTHIGDLELTENLMKQMKDVANGKRKADDCLAEVQQMIVDDIKAMAANSGRAEVQAVTDAVSTHTLAKKCPFCGGKVTVTATGYECENHKKKGCNFSFSRFMGGANITEEDILSLADGKEIGPYRMTGKKTGKEFETMLKLNAKEKKLDFLFVDSGNTTGEATGMKCPVCGKPIVKTPWGYACSAKNKNDPKSCQFSIGNTIAGATLTNGELEDLIKGGTSEVKEFTSKAGKKFKAKISLKKDGSIEFEFDDSGSQTNLKCPVCGAPMILGEKGLFCSKKNRNQGCEFVVWRTVAQKRLTDAEIKKLIQDGKTGEIDGFVSKSGKKFSARLKIEDGSVKFDF